MIFFEQELLVCRLPSEDLFANIDAFHRADTLVRFPRDQIIEKSLSIYRVVICIVWKAELSDVLSMAVKTTAVRRKSGLSLRSFKPIIFFDYLLI